MKKILLSFMLFLGVISYSFEMNSLDFDREVLRNRDVSKNFIIKNGTETLKKYELESDDKNIKIHPSKFVLGPNKSKEFQVSVKAGKNLGKKNYFLIIKEKNIEKKNSENKTVIDKTIRIKQSYIVK